MSAGESLFAIVSLSSSRGDGLHGEETGKREGRERIKLIDSSVLAQDEEGNIVTTENELVENNE